MINYKELENMIEQEIDNVEHRGLTSGNIDSTHRLLEMYKIIQEIEVLETEHAESKNTDDLPRAFLSDFSSASDKIYHPTTENGKNVPSRALQGHIQNDDSVLQLYISAKMQKMDKKYRLDLLKNYLNEQEQIIRDMASGMCLEEKTLLQSEYNRIINTL